MSIPLLFYIAIIGLGLLVIAQYLALGNQLAPKGMRPMVIALVLVVVTENLYYGFGRVYHDLYNGMSSYWPGVLFYKLGYIIALAKIALILRPSKP
tara:strand:+ start:971 stop:1258 length:288 start_codon:yes stop_codon:yes gene_type:complete